MSENNSARQKKLKRYLLDRKMKMWNDLRDEFFRKLGNEYNSQFDNPHDIEELSLIDLLEDMGIAVADHRRADLEQMDAALRKIDDGTYGTCEECGEEIDEGRLKAVPYAEYCVKCKSGMEPVKKPTL